MVVEELIPRERAILGMREFLVVTSDSLSFLTNFLQPSPRVPLKELQDWKEGIPLKELQEWSQE